MIAAAQIKEQIEELRDANVRQLAATNARQQNARTSDDDAESADKISSRNDATAWSANKSISNEKETKSNRIDCLFAKRRRGERARRRLIVQRQLPPSQEKKAHQHPFFLKMHSIRALDRFFQHSDAPQQRPSRSLRPEKNTQSEKNPTLSLFLSLTSAIASPSASFCSFLVIKAALV